MTALPQPTQKSRLAVLMDTAQDDVRRILQVSEDYRTLKQVVVALQAGRQPDVDECGIKLQINERVFPLNVQLDGPTLLAYSDDALEHLGLQVQQAWEQLLQTAQSGVDHIRQGFQAPPQAGPQPGT